LDSKRPTTKISFPSTTHYINGSAPRENITSSPRALENGSPKPGLYDRKSSFDGNVTRDLEELIEELGKGDYKEQSFQYGVSDDLLDFGFIDDLTEEDNEINKEKRKRL